jgi:hypothetical protein
MKMKRGLSLESARLWRAGALGLIFILIAPVHGVSAQEYVHLEYDWEGDDVDVQGHPGEEFEACPACHAAEHMTKPKVCEDCHLPNSAGPHQTGTDFTLRTDYAAPIVYEHYYRAEDIWVKNQSYGGLSTCFGSDPSLEGTCHGVSYVFADIAGGHFAFNWNWTGEIRDRDVYEYTAPASSLPDTTDCLFCHNSDNLQLRTIWGDATQVNSSHSKLENNNCYECHVEGGTKPASFHQMALYVAKEGDDTGEATTPPGNRLGTAVVVLILALVSYLLLVRRPDKK